MKSFEFASAGRIIFGSGSAQTLGELGRDLGERALLVCGSGRVAIDQVLNGLRAQGLEVTLFRVNAEPTLQTIEQALEVALAARCDVIIGLGGGSVLDTAKAIGALIANTGDILDYLEVVGKGLPLTNPSRPVICAPTTAGTGTEVTRNAVISVPGQKVKVSMRSPYMLPKVAVVDPLLTVSCPPGVTAASGMDALVQNLEAYVSAAHNALTDAIALKGVRLAAEHLVQAYANGNDLAAREGMSLASLYGGLSLANAGLGAVHGLAGVLGGYYPEAHHGALCGILLPGVMRANLEALGEEEGSEDFRERYLAVSQALTGDPTSTVEQGIAWVEDTLRLLSLPSLSAMGARKEDLAEIAEKSTKSSSMKKNAVALPPAALLKILENAY